MGATAGCHGGGDATSSGSWRLRGLAEVPRDPQMALAIQGLDTAVPPKDRELALLALRKMAENIQQNPGNTKFSRIRKQNPTFLRTVGGIAGTEGAMRALGFNDLEDSAVWHFAGTPADVQRLNLGLAELLRALPK